MYNCTKCGSCCQSLPNLGLLGRLNRGDGTCIYYDDNTKLCTVYNIRPLACNIDDIYKYHYSDILNKDTYYSLTSNMCQFIRDKVVMRKSSSKSKPVSKSKAKTPSKKPVSKKVAPKMPAMPKVPPGMMGMPQGNADLGQMAKMSQGMMSQQDPNMMM